MKILSICLLMSGLLLINSFNIDFNEITDILNEEKILTKALNNYIETENIRIKEIQQFVDNSVEYKLDNPIDIYLSIKRLKKDWRKIIPLIDTNVIQMNETFKKIVYSSDTLASTANEFAKLTVMYELDIKLLADGIIKYKSNLGQLKTFETNKSLDAFDCYLIGKQTYLNNNTHFADQWLNEAINKSESIDNKLKAKILELKALINYDLGEKQNAYSYLEESLFIEDNEKNDLEYNIPKNEINFEDILKRMSIKNSDEKVYSKRQTDRLCRGNDINRNKVRSKLFCYFLNTTNKPYLRLTRIKVEVLYKRPQILLFHEFLSVSETQLMKTVGVSDLIRLRVLIAKTGRARLDSRRVGEGVFLRDNKTIELAHISKRIGYVTGLDMSTAESYNLIKYRIGGFYKEHRDSNGVNYNRTATWINYLNDVESGGATYFPLLDLSVWPEKSSAIFWFNHKSSGQIDLNLVHGGCPVLLGEKWIATKWIHYEGQEFNQPCSKNKNSNNYLI